MNLCAAYFVTDSLANSPGKIGRPSDFSLNFLTVHQRSETVDFFLGPSIPGLVTDIQVNVYIGKTLSRLIKKSYLHYNFVSPSVTNPLILGPRFYER